MKKFFSIFIVFMLCFSIQLNALAISFSDLASNHWAYKTIISLANSGVINGYPNGTFAPERTVTRAEYLKLILTALYDGNDSFETSEFKKVHWAFPYIVEAQNCGYIDKDFISHMADIDKEITRLEMAKILSKICSSNQISVTNENVQTSTFSDIKSLSASEQNAILLVAKSGFIKGYPDGTFGPNRIVTRAECATIIERLMNAL